MMARRREERPLPREHCDRSLWRVPSGQSGAALLSRGRLSAEYSGVACRAPSLFLLEPRHDGWCLNCPGTRHEPWLQSLGVTLAACTAVRGRGQWLLCHWVEYPIPSQRLDADLL